MNNELITLVTEISKHWGWEVGNKVREEIDSVIGAADVDIEQLQSAIQTIQGLLDADPGTEEFDVGQNIVAQLRDHLTRIANLESDVATLKGDEDTEGSVAHAIKQERERADSAYLSRAELSDVDVENLSAIFRRALDCGFAGKPIEDVLNGTNDCAEESNDNGDSNDGGDSGGSTEDSDNSSSDENGDSGSDSDGNNEDGDGAVI